jgi:hypothetical protein
MGDTKTVTLSPTIQQKLIQINAPVFAAVTVLKELGLFDAVAVLATGKPLTPQTLSLSPMAAGQLCLALSRVSATDSMAAEVGALVNSIPPAMRTGRTGRPSMAQPMPTRVAPPLRAPAPKSATPTKAK